MGSDSDDLSTVVMRWVSIVGSVIAFLLAVADSTADRLPETTPEIWLSAALALAALALVRKPEQQGQ
jgi:cobalamin synthase